MGPEQVLPTYPQPSGNSGHRFPPFIALKESYYSLVARNSLHSIDSLGYGPQKQFSQSLPFSHDAGRIDYPLYSLAASQAALIQPVEIVKMPEGLYDLRLLLISTFSSELA